MDTNMAQALKMAAGVLIALMIIAALTYFFRELTPFQQQIEDIEALEQTADFNKEYEVYNKSLMLGVDIISVINKAYSNNIAYIEAYGYSEDIKNNYLIDIVLLGKGGNDIELTQTLDIRLTTWYTDPATSQKKVKEISIDVADLENDSKKDLEKMIGKEPEDVWEPLEIKNDITLIYPNIKKEDINDPDIKHIFIKYQNDSIFKKYKINPLIYETIIMNTELRKTLNNTNDDTKDDWTKAILETYAYSLKTKKFRCVGVENSSQTGRIIKMTFQEI